MIFRQLAGFGFTGEMVRMPDEPVILNPAVDVETATGFAAPYNWGEQLKPVRGAAAGRAGGPSGSV